MASSVYNINKGINRSIEFKGFKAQYIWYLGGMMLGLLILFAIMYVIGVSVYICLGLVLTAGTIATMKIQKMSNEFGEHGMMKKTASLSTPKILKARSRQLFINYKRYN